MRKKDWLYWSPRAITIFFIVFISIFALDVFFEGYGFWETIAALFMHLIPSFVLIIILAIAWKNEYAGSILFILLGIAFTLFFKTYMDIPGFLLLSAPVFLIGALFLLQKKRRK